MNAVEIRQLTLSFADKPLFVDFNFDIAHARWSAVLGRSGVGKSTLLRVIAGLEQNALKSGKITFKHCRNHQQKIAFMAQNDGLFPWLSVLDNVQLAQHLQGTKNKASRQQALSLLEKVKLADYQHKPCYQLSGGQRQRVALARTLMQSSDLILMDEPFSALDVVTRQQLYQLATTLLAGKTVLLVTHDPQEALQLCDDIFVLQKQTDRVVLSHKVSAVVHSPQQPQFWQLYQQLFSLLQEES
ncbi:ABC transporter ATP-binding protein [Gallibacterium anatis]|uniref:ABC transporter ATP-binding protein n=1 Tax=Gallibacterium anatis TaxID=750 RepID=UPI0039FDDA60